MAKSRKKTRSTRNTGGHRRHSRRKRGRGLFQKIALAFFVLIIIGGAGLLIAYRSYAAGLPTLATMSDYRRSCPLITTVYDERGRVIAEFSEERRVLLSHDEIPPTLWKAFVAIEDKRFFQHKGVDYYGIARAFMKNIEAGHIVEGGSSITQQIARSFFLSREKRLSRKIKEALLALRIERNFTKDEILNIYMNQIYFGHGAYGVGAAAAEFFGKTAGQLSIAEMALLAGLPNKPTKLDPFKNPDGAIARRNTVLDRMKEQGIISPEEADEARKEKPRLVRRENPTRKATPYFTEYVRQYLVKKYGHEAVYTQGLKVFTTVDAEYDRLARDALRWGIRRVDRRLGWRGPEKHLEGTEYKNYLEKNKGRYSKPPKKDEIVEAVVTGVPGGNDVYARLKIGGYSARMPLKYWKWARKINDVPYRKARLGMEPRSELQTGDVVMVKIRERDGSGAMVVSLEQNPLVQGALYSIDPYTGVVKALVGGYDFTRSEFNRATQAKRQPGSAFKPILYTAAMESGFTPATVVNDAPVVLSGAHGEWRPGNYGGKFSGPQTVAYGLQRSVNTISIKLAMDMGIGRVIKFARKMGIESELNADLSLALGSATLSLKELCRAYGTLAAEGLSIKPVFVRRVYDRDGKLLEDRVPVVEGFDAPPEDPVKFRAWSSAGKEPFWGPEGFAFRRSVGLARGKGALDPDTVYVMVSLLRNVVEHGTGRNARLIGVETAGKTGTTNDYKDALFLGFTTQLITGVWIGYDDGRISLGRGSTGGDLAAPVFQRYMRNVINGRGVPDFPRPEGVVIYSFDLLTGTFPGPDSKKVGRAAFREGEQPAPYIPPPAMGEDFLQSDIKMQDQDVVP